MPELGTYGSKGAGGGDAPKLPTNKLLSIVIAFVLLLTALTTAFAEESSIFQFGDNGDSIIQLHEKLIEFCHLSDGPSKLYSATTETTTKTLQTTIGWDPTGTIYGLDDLDVILSIDADAAFGNVLRNAETPQLADKSDYQTGIWRAASGGSGTREIVDIYDAPADGVISGFYISATSEDPGFKGACMALIDTNAEDESLEWVEREYLKSFPELKGKYLGTVCQSADGVNLTSL